MTKTGLKPLDATAYAGSTHCCDNLAFNQADTTALQSHLSFAYADSVAVLPALSPVLCRPAAPQELLRFALSDVDVSQHPLGKDAPVSELLTGPSAADLRIWPDAQLLPEFQPIMLRYFTAVNGLATRLIELAAIALGLAPKAFLADDAAQETPAWQTLMLLHYPAQATDAQRGEFACGEHKDRFTQVCGKWESPRPVLLVRGCFVQSIMI